MRLSEKIRSLLTGETKLNTRSVIFLACLALSFSFWLLAKLSNTYIESIPVPVSYVNLPSNKVLISSPPDELYLQLKATGFEILYCKLNGLGDPLVIDASPKSLKRLPSADAGTYALITEKKIADARVGLDQTINLIGIIPDTIIFSFKDKVEKQLPVRFKGNLGFHKQYGQVGAQSFQPATVTVTGPPEIMDTLKVVFTDSMDLNNLNENTTMTLKLNGGQHNMPLTITPDEAQMTIAVEKFTEGSVTVPLKRVGSYKGGSVKLFPPEISIAYLVPLSQFDKVHAEQFEAQVDLNAIAGGDQTLIVALKEHPNSVKRVRPVPTKVEYIVIE